MGKNRRRTLQAYDSVHNVTVDADSEEECDFFEWLCEAYTLGIIQDFQYQPREFQLSDNINYNNIDGKSRCLFRAHVYNPDFQITFDHNKYLELSKEFKIDKSELSKHKSYDVYVDVKGTFAKSDGGRSFSINQKWVYDKYKLYIYKLVPKEFFKTFGVPERCRLTKKTKKPRKAYQGYKSIAEVFSLQ